MGGKKLGTNDTVSHLVSLKGLVLLRWREPRHNVSYRVCNEVSLRGNMMLYEHALSLGIKFIRGWEVKKKKFHASFRVNN